MENKTEIVKKGINKASENGEKIFELIDKSLPNTPVDKAGKSVGKNICKCIDKVVDFLF